jgi:hypothetical protein
MILEQIKQQVGLFAATDAGYHLNESIVLFIDELIQIDVSLNFHIIVLLSAESFCELSQFHPAIFIKEILVQNYNASKLKTSINFYFVNLSHYNPPYKN